MRLRNTPIKQKLMTVILLTSGTVLLLTSITFFAYEFVTFRKDTVLDISTLGRIIAANSTAALAFADREAAKEILATLQVEGHIVAAGLYDREGNLFAYYSLDLLPNDLPAKPGATGYDFEESHLAGFQPVVQGNRFLGTLYLKSDMKAMYERFQLYGIMGFLVVAISLLLAYLLSRVLQQQISRPILNLAETARAISERRDYSVRATKVGEDELGLLTDAFNHMLTQIHDQNRALSESEERYRAIVESQVEMVCRFRPEGNILFVNGAYARSRGTTPEALRGVNFWNFIEEEDRPNVRALLDRLRPGTPEVHIENRFETNEGVRWTLWTNRGLAFDADGRATEVQSSGIDITDRKQAEQEISQLNAELENRVIERTAQLQVANEQLATMNKKLELANEELASEVEERKLAEEEIRILNEELEERVRHRTVELESSNKELESFSYSVSHDLAAPLRSIDGFSQILLEDYGQRLDDTARGYLQRMRRAAQHMAALIDALLMLSRTARLELHRQEVDLGEIATGILANLREAEPDRRVEIFIAGNAVAQGDQQLLHIALQNLLQNAWKFTRKQATARIEFDVLPPSDGENKSVYFVRDDGVGFEMAYLSQLFKPFQRLHRPDEFEGTGIGLATVQRIIRRHGGKIWAEGKLNEGATFYFTL